jgi:hypothetical protein
MVSGEREIDSNIPGGVNVILYILITFEHEEF